jgi:hypothetical protein
MTIAQDERLDKHQAKIQRPQGSCEGCMVENIRKHSPLSPAAAVRDDAGRSEKRPLALRLKASGQ